MKSIKSLIYGAVALMSLGLVSCQDDWDDPQANAPVAINKPNTTIADLKKAFCIDEAYDQFVGIVADGRNLKESEVRKLADGRIYTAKQAKKLGLVDEIGTFEEAIKDMKKEYNLEDCQLEEFEITSSTDIWSLLGESAESKLSSGSFSADMVKELTALNGKVEFSYISEIKK